MDRTISSLSSERETTTKAHLLPFFSQSSFIPLLPLFSVFAERAKVFADRFQETERSANERELKLSTGIIIIFPCLFSILNRVPLR